MYTYELYVVTNLINGKRYVGQTRTDIGYIERFDRHYHGALYGKHKSYFHKALLKYGKENFSVKRI